MLDNFFNDFDQVFSGYQKENFTIQAILNNKKSNMSMLTKMFLEDYFF